MHPAPRVIGTERAPRTPVPERLRGGYLPRRNGARFERGALVLGEHLLALRRRHARRDTAHLLGRLGVTGGDDVLDIGLLPVHGVDPHTADALLNEPQARPRLDGLLLPGVPGKEQCQAVPLAKRQDMVHLPGREQPRLVDDQQRGGALERELPARGLCEELPHRQRLHRAVAAER